VGELGVQEARQRQVEVGVELGWPVRLTLAMPDAVIGLAAPMIFFFSGLPSALL
jgi:hypothetical protein